ncbi:MAG TPA: hypothetical protein VFF52_09200 [Isosphaeraceae bacterium]|nr:hypothetical protein [Isosphaeraceae bacterium]
MAQQPSDRRRRTESSASSRRGFLHQAAGVAAGIAALPVESPAAERGANAERLPTISLGSHQVTRLIIGGNPIYGHSHFNRLLSRHQTDWHTPERVIELLKRCEQCGLNTWQNSYAERTLADLDRYRREGGTMQWLCLGKPDWDQHPDRIDDAAQRKPIGIAPHGALNEKLFRQKKLTVLTDLLKRIRDQGVLVGLSAHDPRLIETAEERGWDVDYYMCCLYYLTRPKDELRRLLGDHLPLGEVYLPSDPPRMFQTIQATRKPCLAYKVLAAGRRVGNLAEVRGCFLEAFAHIKPTDAVIVGMYQQLGDQVGENAAIVRSICSKA